VCVCVCVCVRARARVYLLCGELKMDVYSPCIFSADHILKIRSIAVCSRMLQYVAVC